MAKLDKYMKEEILLFEKWTLKVMCEVVYLSVIECRKTIFHKFRPVPFNDFKLFVVLSLLTGGSSNAGRKYASCVGRTGHEKKEDNK